MADKSNHSEPTMEDILDSIRRILAEDEVENCRPPEVQTDKQQIPEQASGSPVRSEEDEDALMREWAAIDNDFRGARPQANERDQMAEEWEVMLWPGKPGDRSRNKDLPSFRILTQDEINTLLGFDSEEPVQMPVIFDPGPCGCDKYLVDITLDPSVADGAIAVQLMSKIIGVMFTGGRLRVNSNQLCKFLLASQGRLNDELSHHLSGYRIVQILRDTSNVIDVSGH